MMQSMHLDFLARILLFCSFVYHYRVRRAAEADMTVELYMVPKPEHHHFLLLLLLHCHENLTQYSMVLLEKKDF
jgi:hypothetical protein